MRARRSQSSLIDAAWWMGRSGMPRETGARGGRSRSPLGVIGEREEGFLELEGEDGEHALRQARGEQGRIQRHGQPVDQVEQAVVRVFLEKERPVLQDRGEKERLL